MRLTKSSKFFLLAVAVIVFSFYYFDYDYSSYTELARTFYEKPFKIKVYNQTVKHILFWTNFYTIPLWDMKKETYDQEDLKSVNCPVTNCILTHNKNYLKNVEAYDALIFHIGSEPHFPDTSIPLTRNPGQFYILASKE